MHLSRVHAMLEELGLKDATFQYGWSQRQLRCRSFACESWSDLTFVGKPCVERRNGCRHRCDSGVHSVGESNTKSNFSSSAPNRPTFPSQARRGPPRITTTSGHQHRRILQADCQDGGGLTAPRIVSISRDTWQRRCLTCRETRQRSKMTARRVLNACSSCRAMGVAPLLPRKRLQTINSAPHDNTVVLESAACLWLHHRVAGWPWASFIFWATLFSMSLGRPIFFVGIVAWMRRTRNKHEHHQISGPFLI